MGTGTGISAGNNVGPGQPSPKHPAAGPTSQMFLTDGMVDQAEVRGGRISLAHAGGRRRFFAGKRSGGRLYDLVRCRGERVFTTSSSPGISLMSEAISYIAGGQCPAVFVNIMRGGPGWAVFCPPRPIISRPQRASATAIAAAGHGSGQRAGSGGDDDDGLPPGGKIPKPGDASGRWPDRPDDGAG